MLLDHREIWLSVNAVARKRAAQLPFVIVDVHFLEEAWWRDSLTTGNQSRDVAPDSNGLPNVESEHLMLETIMFAWQTARWDRTVAQISFAMLPSVVDIVAALTPQQLREIAARSPQALRVRWSEDVVFWRDLLTAAGDEDPKRLSDLQLHAKLALCGHISRQLPAAR